MSYIPWYVTTIRLVVPFLIFRFPLVGILISMMADGADWILIGVTSNEINTVYQNWDKVMDLYLFLFIVWVVWHWRDAWARRVALGLFGYRILGVILFWITGTRALLFFFPNIFENFVIVCLILFWISKKETLNLGVIQKSFMLSILIIPKMFQEYFQHFLGRQPWELYSFGSSLGFQGTALYLINPLLWGTLLYVIPISAFLLYIRGTKYTGVR